MKMESLNQFIGHNNSTTGYVDEIEKLKELAKENTSEGQFLFYQTFSKLLNVTPQETSERIVKKITKKPVQNKRKIPKKVAGQIKKIEKEKLDIKKVEIDISDRIVENACILFSGKTEYTESEFEEKCVNNLKADEIIEVLEEGNISLIELLKEENDNDNDNGYLF